MNAKIICFGLALLIVGCGEKEKKSSVNFTGAWEAQYEDGYHFNVNLTQKGTEISGDYCAWPKNSERIDCATDSGDNYSCEIFGDVETDSAHVQFVSCYSGDTGKASLFISNHILHWKTTFNPYNYNDPITGANHEWNGVPNKALLKKKLKSESR